MTRLAIVPAIWRGPPTCEMLATMYRSLALLSAVLVALAPRLASANAAAPLPPATLASLETARTPLQVRSASLAIDCSAGNDTCRLEVTYDITNPTAEAAGGVAVFYSMMTTDLAVTVNGTPTSVELSAEQVAAYDATVTAERTAADNPLAGQILGDRHGFAVELAGGASTRVVVTGTLHSSPRRRRSGYVISPDRARHLALTPEEPSTDRLVLRYFVAPIRTWGAFPTDMAFTLKHPASWVATLQGPTTVPQRSDGALRVHEGRLPTSLDELSIDLVPDAPWRPRGGIFVGLGGHVDNADGLRLRVGGEVSWRGSRFISLAGELETGDDELGVVVVPALTVASPQLLFIPSLSIGAGVPVRVAPQVDVGGRVQLDAHLGPFGYLVAFDYYPGMDAGPRRYTVAMMFQLSL